MSIRGSLVVFVALLAGCPRPGADVTPPAVTDTAAPKVEAPVELPTEDAGEALPEELCGDGIDNDNDGHIDEEGVGAVTLFVDADEDGWGDVEWPTLSCLGAPYTSDRAGDCDDADATAFPGAAEVWYDGVDQDCNPETEYDKDGDRQAVVGAPVSWAVDCNDADATIQADGAEVWYNGVDEDCDGADDYDRDGDGFAALGTPGAQATDCDDGAAGTFPGAAEVWYDGVDQDCNPLTEYDQDGDGFAAVGTTGFLPSDCDDTAAGTFRGALEVWYDGVDQDCDASTEFDRDGDGHAALGSAGAQADDCDDLDLTIFGGAAEVWYDGVDQDCDATTEYDRDGDGQSAAGSGGPNATDCDDLAATTFAGNAEVWYDGVDQDCDASTEYDRDGDGQSLLGSAGASAYDCDDSAAAVYVGAAEVWYDGVDQDCDATTEFDRDGDGLSPLGSFGPNSVDCDDLDADHGAPDLFFFDGDGDAYGDVRVPTVACEAPDGFVSSFSDCDDTLAIRNPGAPEVPYDGVDQDCDGAELYDVDGDGFLHASSGARTVDCDDEDPSFHPGAAEVWYDGMDQDCDPDTEWDQDRDGILPVGAPGAGQGDCDDLNANVGLPGAFFADGDGDGHGDAARGMRACSLPVGFVSLADDCDDRVATTYPGAADLWHDGVDANCDGANDFDADHDGVGTDAGDCDDNNPAVSPALPEIFHNDADEDCVPTNDDDEDGDGIDSIGRDADCDDNDVRVGGPTAVYRDADGDGFGDDHTYRASCDGPIAGFVLDATDCDDSLAEVNPRHVEVCDGEDNDCDGGVDQGVGGTWWPDEDGDGFGDARGASVRSCTAPAGMVSSHDDCDDGEDDTFPNNREVCDGVDNDCVLTNAVDPASSCGVHAVRHDAGDSRYFTPDPLFAADHDGAQAACASKGYHLFTPESNSENLTVRTALGVWRADTWTGMQNCQGGLGYYDAVTGDCSDINGIYLADHGFRAGAIYTGGANIVGLTLDPHEYTWSLSVFADRDTAFVICERER